MNTVADEIYYSNIVIALSGQVTLTLSGIDQLGLKNGRLWWIHLAKNAAPINYPSFDAFRAKFDAMLFALCKNEDGKASMRVFLEVSIFMLSFN